MSGKKRKLSSRNTTGYTGVRKSGKRFRAEITIDRKKKCLGTYATAKEAALAYDRAVVQHKLSSSKLNYPDGLPIDDEDYEELMNPKKKKRLKSHNTSGYTGVSKNGKRFQAKIYFDREIKCLGTYDTPKEAALAYDRAVIQHKLSSSRLNFPNDYTTSSEDDESSEEESDDSSSSSSSSDSCHSSDDDESDDDEEDAVEPSPVPEAHAQPQFVREPMLDQLFADSQNKKQEEEQQPMEVEEVREVEEEDSGCDSDSLWL
jgi:hypothetical protein